MKVELAIYRLLHGRILRLAVFARLKIESGDLGSRRSHSGVFCFLLETAGNHRLYLCDNNLQHAKIYNVYVTDFMRLHKNVDHWRLAYEVN